MNIHITVNQTPSHIPKGTSLKGVIELFGLPDSGCVFAVNELIVAKNLWEQTQLNDGDQIALFQVIAGG